MRYVFVTDELPVSGSAGHLAMNASVIRWLQGLGHEVVVLLVGARLAAPMVRFGRAAVAGPHIRNFRNLVIPNSARGMSRALARRVFRALPASFRAARPQPDAVLGKFASPQDLAWCARYISQLQPDAVLVDTIFRSGLLALPELAGVNSVIIAHDLFHRRHAALLSAGYAVQPAQLSRADEAAWLGRAKHIAAIQPDEARAIAQMCPVQNVFTAPMPAIPNPRLPGYEQIPGRLVFVGSATLPNMDGLRWFLAEVWQHLAGHGVTLDLLGDCGGGIRHLPEGVIRYGRVAELAPWLHRASLAIAPLRVGSGLKIKLLDYARHGLYTVATPEALAGFERDTATPFITAKSARGFAQAILRQLEITPPQERPLAYVKRHYGMGPSFAALAAAIGLKTA